MTITWQQKKIGEDLIAAATRLKIAKNLGKVPGSLAQGLSAEMQASERRRIAHLIDMADKYGNAK